MYTYRRNSDRELRHGVEGRRAAVDDLLNKGGDRSAGGPLLRKGSDLLLRGDLAREQEPEKTFRQGLRATRRLGECLLDLRNCLATETDTLLCKSQVRSCMRR